ncbi:hypothetical protein [Flavobacterium sp.]|jgi:hypothetical protein|uniref:hypothetical protein n=1 Tax=Flavobacterium sp. TaxID=239 RepID=UPI0037C028F3
MIECIFICLHFRPRRYTLISQNYEKSLPIRISNVSTPPCCFYSNKYRANGNCQYKNAWSIGTTTESYSANGTIVAPSFAAQSQGYNSANQSFPMEGTNAVIISSAPLNCANIFKTKKQFCPYNIQICPIFDKTGHI